MEATPMEVKNIAAQASSILANLQNADEEISIFQGIVDAYVKSVAKFLAVQRDVASHTAEVSAVEDNLHSARATCQGAVRTSRSLEKHGKEVAKAIEAAETKLQGLRDEAQSIKQQQSRQAGVVSVAESDADALQRRLDELRASRASSDDLAQAQSELDQCKKAIEAAMH